MFRAPREFEAKSIGVLYFGWYSSDCIKPFPFARGNDSSMNCPYCNTAGVAARGRCSACGRSLPSGVQVAAVTATPLPIAPIDIDAATMLGANRSSVVARSTDDDLPTGFTPGVPQHRSASSDVDRTDRAVRRRPGLRLALSHHPAARRRRHGRGVSGVGRRARRRRRAQSDPAGRHARSSGRARDGAALQAGTAARAVRSRTRTSSAFTTSARSTASSTSRCRTSRAPISPRC